MDVLKLFWILILALFAVTGTCVNGIRFGGSRSSRSVRTSGVRSTRTVRSIRTSGVRATRLVRSVRTSGVRATRLVRSVVRTVRASRTRSTRIRTSGVRKSTAAKIITTAAILRRRKRYRRRHRISDHDRLKCYTCSSLTDSFCGDPYEFHLRRDSADECLPGQRSCVLELMNTTIAGSSGASIVWRRYCSSSIPAENDDCRDLSQGSTRTTQCFCNDDYCNTSSNLYSALVWLAGALSLIWMALPGH